MRKRFLSLVSGLLACSILFTSCNSLILPSFLGGDKSGASSETGTVDSDSSHFVSTIRPQDDYYGSINESWLQSTPEPTGNPIISPAVDNHLSILRYLYQTLENNISSGKDQNNDDIGKLTRFYKTASDFENRDAQGMAPLKPYIEKIKAVDSISSLQIAATDLDMDGIGNFSSFAIYADAKDSTTNRLYLGGPALGLADKSYYEKSDDPSVQADREKTVNAYKNCLLRLLVMSGETQADAQEIVEKGYAIEAQLAASTLSQEDTRNSDLTYNKMQLSQLAATMPNFDITGFLSRTGLNNPAFIIVTQKDYYKKLNEVMVSANLESLKDYMYLQMLIQTTDYLSHDAANIGRDLFNAQNDTVGHMEETDLAINLTQSNMDDILGRLYVEGKFSKEDKDRATEMVKTLLATYEERLQNLDWMTPETQKKAVEKLKGITIKVGYPDKWTDYSGLTVTSYNDGGSVFQNVVNNYKFGYQSFVASLDQPVDRSKWEMSPYVTNAYYKGSANEIVITAAILQPPFYSPTNTDSQNYGGIGVVIAHEISHAFDDEGRKYDKDGNLNNWWTNTDLENFKKRSQVLVEQYNAAEPYPGYHINGSLTLGENIADLGGLSCVTQVVGELPDGSYEELFESYAKSYRSKTTEAFAKRMIVEDTHSPDKYRVNIPLSNVEAFYSTYQVSEGDGMYLPPKNRISIW